MKWFEKIWAVVCAPEHAAVRGKVYAGVAFFGLCVLSTARFASASYDEANIPIGDATAQDAIVSGTVRMLGEHFIFYNGSRLESLSKNVRVRFSRGGSLILCPHSRLQILTSNEQAGLMLAFQKGGTEEPFPVHPKDVVLTPDWRVEMSGDVQDGDVGVLRISSSSRGELCIAGDTQPGAFFKVSQLAGDASYSVSSSGTARFSNGMMLASNAGCGCDALDTDGDSHSTSAVLAYDWTNPNNATAPPPQPNADQNASQPRSDTDSSAVQAAKPSQVNAPSVASPDAGSHRSQHPQDVVGYVRSFVHLIFGR
jgi:hypothetical protein